MSLILGRARWSRDGLVELCMCRHCGPPAPWDPPPLTLDPPTPGTPYPRPPTLTPLIPDPPPPWHDLTSWVVHWYRMVSHDHVMGVRARPFPLTKWRSVLVSDVLFCVQLILYDHTTKGRLSFSTSNFVLHLDQILDTELYEDVCRIHFFIVSRSLNTKRPDEHN